ncbi:MAG: response regulator transcription factor [Microthrixaceae bacterium]|nr:response regulator transcription factor [Microthrixaceae bacterium]
MRVLLVEDDSSISEPLRDALERDGAEVQLLGEGAAAPEAALGVDVVLLDLGLPDMDGTEVCRRIRSISDVPVIVISARQEEGERVLLLEIGADDYLVKPFGVRELSARIRAVLRRSSESLMPECISAGALEVDLRSHRAAIEGRELELTPKEFDLLVLLAGEPGRVHARQDILETVWDPHWYGPTKTLDVHVASLRRKLGDPKWIETVRGVGYRFAAQR